MLSLALRLKQYGSRAKVDIIFEKSKKEERNMQAIWYLVLNFIFL